MVPLLLKLRVPRKRGDILTLYLPLFLLWLVLIPVMIIILPFILIAVIFTRNSEYRRLLLYIFPLLFELLGSLKGLKIDVQDKENKIYISFI